MQTTAQSLKPRMLTGDTPTGRLHLGHWVGSVENRVLLQDQYNCYFIIANVHAFISRAEKPAEIRESVIDIALDYLAVGIDPKKTTIFLQSEVPAIAELTFLFAMLLPFPRLMRNPTIKDEIRDKEMGDNYSFGFLMYPVGQVADILSFRAAVVPVGEDQSPILEMTREIARRFNQVYCHVDPQTADEDYVKKGGLFPIPEWVVGRAKRLVGTGGPGPNGQFLKMSKSLNNAIFLSDSADVVREKVMKMYTDPTRLRATDPGHIENNPLWIFHEMFNPDKTWVAEAEQKYKEGKISDVECKKKLVDVLVTITNPMRQRRLEFEKDPQYIIQVLKEGTERANIETEKTLKLAKEFMYQHYFDRQLLFT
jgi:tryptophanyl-tRNA synthetase